MPSTARLLTKPSFRSALQPPGLRYIAQQLCGRHMIAPPKGPPELEIAAVDGAGKSHIVPRSPGGYSAAFLFCFPAGVSSPGFPIPTPAPKMFGAVERISESTLTD